MALEVEKITIRNKKYPKPDMNRLKRSAVRKLKPDLQRLQDEDIEAVWDVIWHFIPELPEETLDDLELGECKEILEDAGVAKFDTDDEAPSDDESIDLGESSASQTS